MSPDIEELLANREAFGDYVYTPLQDALAQLDERRNDPSLEGKILSFLGNSVPDAFGSTPKVVLARHVITPSYEVTRFLNVPDSLGMEPLFFEYHKDKMIYKNPSKYHLGRLIFEKGIGKKGGTKLEHTNIINFDEAHGAEIGSIRTLSGESLVDFHHGLFLKRFPNLAHTFFDGSTWYSENGGVPVKYYPKFLALFLRNGILFENFLLDQKEISFTREIFLPAFNEVTEHFGIKPLIVRLEPTDIEGDGFWLAYPYALKKLAGLEPEVQGEVSDKTA
jgi:hypothetical protein